VEHSTLVQDPTVLVAHCFVTNSPKALINLVHLALAEAGRTAWLRHSPQRGWTVLKPGMGMTGLLRAHNQPSAPCASVRPSLVRIERPASSWRHPTWQTLALEVIP
jgi:hypothetical protein